MFIMFCGKLVENNKRRYTTKETKKKGKEKSKEKSSVQTFTFRQLCVATNNFSHHNLLGEGGFGRVYKGLIDTTRQVPINPYFPLQILLIHECSIDYSCSLGGCEAT